MQRVGRASPMVAESRWRRKFSPFGAFRKHGSDVLFFDAEFAIVFDVKTQEILGDVLSGEHLVVGLHDDEGKAVELREIAGEQGAFAAFDVDFGRVAGRRSGLRYVRLPVACCERNLFGGCVGAVDTICPVTGAVGCAAD